MPALARLAALIALLAVASPVQAADLTPLDEMPEGWTTLAPGGETMCAMGTPYSFHVRPGARDRVMIFLNGGGACWTGDHCDPSVDPTTYVPSADMPHNDPRTRKGAFDTANPENPFSEWSQVFVSYCTGDVHLGARDTTYTKRDGSEVTIRHRGKANVQAAFDWVTENFAGPDRILVGGGSAGAMSSAYWAGVVQDAYPQSDVIQFAGGGGGYRTAPPVALFEAWGTFEGLRDWPEFSSLDPSSAAYEDFYRVSAARYPQMRFHQFNTAYDAVQEQFVNLLGGTEELYPLLKANLDDLAAEIPTFRSFTAAGEFHTLLRFDEFYSFEAGGVRAVDWVHALANGETVETVTCAADAQGCRGAAD